MLRRPKIRGNILAIAMALMCVLVTIVIAMHTSQTRAVRSVTQAEAELQFRQSAEFAAAEFFSVAQPAPSSLRVSAEEELVGDHQMPDKFGTKLWTGLPNWNPKDQEFAPGHKTYQLTPTTNDQALKVFTDKKAWLVGHSDGGYAAYAPKGNIKLGRAVGWANPAFGDERASPNAFSGVPYLAAASGNIEIERMPHGSAYTSGGDLDLGSNPTDLKLGFKGALPLRHYEDALKTSLQNARQELESSAGSGNKTTQIKGGTLAAVGAVLDMLTSGQPNLDMSLEQAMKFPFPMIPGFSATVPGVFFEFWFHVPYPPDFADIGSVNSSFGAQAGQQAKQLEDQIQALNAQIAAETDEDERNELIEQRQDKLDELDVLKGQIEDFSQQMGAEVGSRTPGTVPGAPNTRNDDNGIPNDGQKGWNYSRLLGNMLNLLTSTITGDLEGIAKSVSADVRLVHFGGKDNIPDFRFTDGFYAKSTWTVPRGRSFRYDGKMTVVGDLWLQKGSVMHVAGDLVLTNPEPGSSPLKPSGKLIMEEGASLIVGGDLRTEGDPRFGSLWVCSAPTKIAPVSTSIFVSGAAHFPYGSFSATNLGDAARAIEGFGGLADSFDILFGDFAPNLAKVAGPFHERQPYFASYATTFQLTIVYTLVGPIPVPTPVPLPKKNILVPIFRVLTMLYTASMNGNLGENTYLHSDWWALGEGVVPAMIKLDPTGPMNSIKSINLNGLAPTLDWNSYLQNLVTTVLEEGAKFAIKEVGQKLVQQVLTSVLPGGSVLDTILGEVVGLIDSKGSTFENLQEQVIQASIGPFVNQFNNLKDKIDDEIKNAISSAYLREVAGPLIYARSIRAGDGDNCLLMSGMLVAEEGIIVDSESFVGSLTSFNGNIEAKNVYFTPVFQRASLYKPKATSTNSIARLTEFQYGKNFDSNQAVDVGTGVTQVTTEGWNR